jgi:hypothetical protein
VGVHCDFGVYDGKITIMGSGGSNFVMGNFAPTPKTTKDDASIEVGNGQSRSNPINIKLDKLACCNQVMAVFLNEKYYHEQSNHIQENQKNTLQFLGYYEFIESRFVMGDSHIDIENEFDDPADTVWQFLTFRLHPHLRVEAKPFIDTFEEIEQLMANSNTQYEPIIIDHDDHGDIKYDLVDIGGWMQYNHTLYIQDVITEMINNGNIKGLCSQVHPENEIMDKVNIQDSVCKSKQTFDEESGEYMNNDGLGVSFEEQVVDEEADELYDEKYAGDINNDVLGVYPEYETTDDSYVLEKTKSKGTACSIEDVVNCCIINGVCCGLRYSKKSLRKFDGRLCATPLTDESLGVAHRICPSLSPNRALDVNLCFLRIAFLDHKSLASSIQACMRCDDSTLHIETLCEMTFQIILLRFTGRICRFEEYKLWQLKYNDSSDNSCFLPLRKDIVSFIEYMEIRQKKRTQQNSGMVTMTGWISRQHDGVIPYHLKTNLYKFTRFISFIAEHVGTSVRNMRKKKKVRNSCIEIIIIPEPRMCRQDW